MCFSKKWVIPLLLPAFLAGAWCLAAPAPSDEPRTRGLVVHEWGTFSTFSGSDGKSLKFYPYDNDLPEFVHGYMPKDSKAAPQGGTISLETPVLYFYSENPLTAYVRVEFPKGTMTEWYPQALRTEQKLIWQGIKVRPREDLELPSGEKKSRYYAARKTDAAPLLMTFQQGSGQLTEQEKFLFYRGVGSFDLPINVRARGNGKFSVSWEGNDPGSDLVLVQVRAGKVRFRQFALTHHAGTALQEDVQLPEKEATVDDLGEAMVKLLIGKGLYEKEARAMVETWSSAWFGEDGARVLYLLPTGITNDLLPLKVEPKPTTLVRVLVGRHDILSPEREKEIDACVTELNRSTPEPDAKQRAASVELASLGRYSSAAWEQAEIRLKIRR